MSWSGASRKTSIELAEGRSSGHGRATAFPDSVVRRASDGIDYALVAFSTSGDVYACDVYRVRVSDGQTQRLTHDYGIDAAPSFSPDGAGIVYASQ